MYKSIKLSYNDVKNFRENKMIKGVSKNIIEVQPRNNRYYERIIIILKDIPSNDEYEFIEHHTEQMLKSTPTAVPRQNNIIYSLILAVSGALTAISAVLLFLLFV